MKKILLAAFLFFITHINAQIITTVAGNGATAYGGDGGPATAAELWYPICIAKGNDGNLYIADNYNFRIRKINTSGTITTVAGNGTYGFSGDGGQATAAEISYPVGITVDVLGNVYFSDRDNNRVRKVTTAGIITTVAGNGTNTFSGDGGQATSAGLNGTGHLISDASNNLYIISYPGIRMINAAGIISTIDTIGGWGMTLDPYGNFYFTNNDNRIRKLNTAGVISVFAGDGTTSTTYPCTICYSGDNGPATAAKLNMPEGIISDAEGNLYFCDTGNNRIRKIDTGGIITTIAGNGTMGFSGDGGLANAAEFFFPSDLTIDAAGNLLILDSQNNRLRIVTNVATVGIENTNASRETNIYPNPSSGNISISCNISMDFIKIIDLLGQTVYEAKLNSENVILKIDNVGVYFVTITSGTITSTKKVIIDK